MVGCSQTGTHTPDDTPTSPSSQIQVNTSTPTNQNAVDGILDNTHDLLFISMLEGRYSHLFSVSLSSLSLTRLTADEWDDITPAVSPDGRKIAFASRRNGYWDIYLLDVELGSVDRLTDTPEYDGAPSWSPDGQWIVYETYFEDNLELAILSTTDLAQPPLRLTDSTASDHSPAWSPGGRQIAFISDRSGEDEVWIADLDRIGSERFFKVSNNNHNSESAPAWSPNGQYIAWAAAPYSTGVSGIYLWDSQTPGIQPQWICAGDFPVFINQEEVLTRISTPNQSYISISRINGGLVLAPFLLPQNPRGLSIGSSSMLDSLPVTLLQAAQLTPQALYQIGTLLDTNLPYDRNTIIDLEDVTAPYPKLNDQVDEAFYALRNAVIHHAGWDALANLESAFIPISAPLNPGFYSDWHYTGRAFTLNSLLIDAGWMQIVRENIDQQAFWRVYLRTYAQDGSQGEPLHQRPWDFSTRYNGDLGAYNEGGSLARVIPNGYWLDFTEIAAQLGWERLAALDIWRTYYPGARFGVFVLTNGLDWHSAMLEIYPPEAILTQTPIPSPTRNPTRTPFGYRTPTPTQTPTPRPTYTP